MRGLWKFCKRKSEHSQRVEIMQKVNDRYSRSLHYSPYFSRSLSFATMLVLVFFLNQKLQVEGPLTKPPSPGMTTLSLVLVAEEQYQDCELPPKTIPNEMTSPIRKQHLTNYQLNLPMMLIYKTDLGPSPRKVNCQNIYPN